MKKKTNPKKSPSKKLNKNKPDAVLPKLEKREEIDEIEAVDEVAELDQSGDEEPEILEEDRY